MIFKTLLTSVAVSMAVASYAQAAIQDGTFEGTDNGKNGPVTVAVTIKAGKIANVKVVKSGESAMIGDAAIARIPAEIVARQSLGVNNVAGASLTSMAIKAASTRPDLYNDNQQYPTGYKNTIEAPSFGAFFCFWEKFQRPTISNNMQ